MRILFVTEKFPYPLDTGGNVRTYHLLRGLAFEHEVTLLSATELELPAEFIEHVMQFCKEVRVVKVRPLVWWRDIASLVRSLVGTMPFVIGRHFRKEMAAAVYGSLNDISVESGAKQSADGGRKFDCVYFNHLDAAAYKPQLPKGTFTVLDQHNVVTNQVRTTRASEERLLRRLILTIDERKLAAFEVATVNEMDHCLVCSGADADYLVSMGVRHIPCVVPNGVDTHYFTPAELACASPPRLVFVGTLDYDPCEKGVWYFCTEILPLLRKEFPELSFVAVGRNPSARLRKLAEIDNGFSLPGRVEDVRPYIWQGSVFVVPLLSGSGTRLKILEAMAAGVPVVSTSIGAEGIAAVNGRHIWIGDSPAEFADRVKTLLLNDAQAEAMRAEARRLVESAYSWEAVHEKLLVGLRTA